MERFKALARRLLNASRQRLHAFNESDDAALRSVFELAYGRQPSPDDMRTIRVAAAAATSNCDLLRRMIALFDRQTAATPISIRFGEKDTSVVDLGDFRMVLTDSDFAVSSAIIANKAYEPHLTRFIREHVKPRMTAIDIGANVGFYSMLFATLVGDLGHVLSFEPNTENCRLILLSAENNGFKNVKLFPLALSRERGSMYFAPMIGSNGGRMPDKAQTLLDPNCIVVPCDRLDAIAPDGHVDFIKIDIEGGEYLALSGAENILRRDRPIVTAEFSLEMLARVSEIAGPDFLRWMAGLGYRIYLLGRNGTGLSEVNNIDQFMTHWGSPFRIEDLAFIPAERASG